MFNRLDEIDENYNICISQAIVRAKFNTLVCVPFLATQKKYKDSISKSKRSFNYTEEDFLKTV